MISIWFFIGLSLLINGVLILAAGIYEIWHPAVHPVVLYQLHASAWWGALMTIVGALYCVIYRPGKKSAS
ncbi:MAG TPA: hypothetical protein VJN93_11845 [Candidatus Acidoferrum sp.]|nr:hypothetical protein [Candidatus Acidoferrum sp.]